MVQKPGIVGLDDSLNRINRPVHGPASLGVLAEPQLNGALVVTLRERKRASRLEQLLFSIGSVLLEDVHNLNRVIQECLIAKKVLSANGQDSF